jgi:3-deoxy-manno-octulosonate cytidylyltransferase (CMP-KDO synthetase)
MKICFVIPARLESVRFPNKITTHVGGVSIVERVMMLSKQLDTLFSERHEVERVLAIDESNNSAHVEIKKLCNEHGVKYLPLSDEQPTSCGSEKVKWVAKAFKGYDYYITLPADEPFMSLQHVGCSIENVIEKRDRKSIYTLFSRFYCREDLESNLSCKILTDTDDETILYTSRAIIPAGKDGAIKGIDLYKKHLGVFIFPKQVLKYDVWKFSSLALHESLEQNMFVNREFNFKVEETKHDGFGIDVPEQVDELEKRFGYNKR